MYAFAEKITRKGKKKNECEEETKKVDRHDGVCGYGAGVYDGGTSGRFGFSIIQ